MYLKSVVGSGWPRYLETWGASSRRDAVRCGGRVGVLGFAKWAATAAFGVVPPGGRQDKLCSALLGRWTLGRPGLLLLDQEVVASGPRQEPQRGRE
jgi:hypothetical protein